MIAYNKISQFRRISRLGPLVLLVWIQMAMFNVCISQVHLNLQTPPPGNFNPEDFTNLVNFDNLSSDTFIVHLLGTVEEEQSGLIFTGTTGTFEVPPGFSSPHYTNYEPVDIEFIDADYEQFVINTNNLPPGEYVFCVRAIEANSGMELSYQCVPHSVFQPSSPILVYPADGDVLLEPMPVFIWLPPAPQPPIELMYNLTIVELLDDQQPYEALISNPAFFTEGEIITNSYPYPAYAPIFEYGKSYVWRIQALIPGGFPIGENNGYSEIGTFDFQEEAEVISYEQKILVHCEIENYTFLLPEEVCESLGGKKWSGDFLLTDYITTEQQAGIDKLFHGLALLNRMKIDSLPMVELMNKFEDVRVNPETGHFQNLEPKPIPGAVGLFIPLILTGHPLDTDEANPEFFHEVYTNEQILFDTLDVYAHMIAVEDRDGSVTARITANHILEAPGDHDAIADFLFDDFFQNIEPILMLLDTSKPGQWEIQFHISLGEQYEVSYSTFVDFPSGYMVAGTDDQIAQMFSVAASYYDRRWRLIQDRIAEYWDKIRRKRNELEEIYGLWGFLYEQNRIIDKIQSTYGPRVKSIQDELDDLPSVPDVPTDQDIADLTGAVAGANDAIDECEDRVKELEDRIAELEGEADDLEQKQLDAMEEMHEIFMKYGWTGSYGFRDTDRHGGYGEGSGCHWGYVGTPGNGPNYGSADENRLNELKNEARNARKEWRKTKESIERLKEELEAAKEECEKLRDSRDELEQELEDAQQAQAQQQAYDARQAVLESQLEDICREIQELLSALSEWCDANPSVCPFKNEIKQLMEDCPPENWGNFWNELNKLIEKKKELEKSLEADAKRVEGEIDDIGKDIDDARNEANDLLEAESRERQRAEQARKDNAAAAKAEAERKKKEERDCLEKFAKWISDNDRYLKRGNTEALEKILEGATFGGEVAGGTAGGVAGGKPFGPSLGSALAQSLFNLGASIFYKWVGDKAQSAVKKIADRHVLQNIAASLIGDKRKCGIIKTDGATSYFFFKDGNRTIVFRISASFGLECLGEV